MTRLMSIPLTHPDRRTVLKLSVSAMVCLSAILPVPRRTGVGTWMLRGDDA